MGNKRNGFDAKRFREQFPLFLQPENSRLIYLDNAATTQKPSSVIDAITDYYLHTNANAHRSSHRLARKTTQMMESTREKAAQFLGATSAEEIIFCRGATEALNLLAASLGAGLQPGDEIILSKAEHHANIVPWQMAAKRTGAKLVYIDSDSHGRPRIEALQGLISSSTRIVSITAASNVLGFKVDLGEVASIIEQGRAQFNNPMVLIVDASQLLAHGALDLRSMGCDFLVGSAHKFYGPTGIGLLYGKQTSLNALPPWQGGGEMITHVGLQSSEYASGVHRFEAGTSSLAEIAGLSSCFDFLMSMDRQAVTAHEHQLVEYLHRELGAIEEIELLTQVDNNVGITTFVPNAGIHIQDIAYWLDERDIAVRLGRHCAEPLMAHLSVSATLRASVAAYTTFDEVEQFVVALKEGIAELRSKTKVDGGVVDGGAKATDLEGKSEGESGASNGGFPIDDLSELKIEDLQAVQSWQVRYKEVLSWGKSISNKPTLRCDAYRLNGCEAEAWMAIEVDKHGRFQIFIDSESRVVLGLAALLLVLVNNKTKDEIEKVDLEAIFSKLGLAKNLSASRNNGFQVMLSKLRERLGGV